MKLSKKFFEDLHKIGEWAFVEKNMWVGKLVPEIIIDNLQKRGISQEDIEGCVCLSIEEAKTLAELFDEENVRKGSVADIYITRFVNRIAQAEMSIASTQCENVSKKDEKIITLTVAQAEKGHEAE